MNYNDPFQYDRPVFVRVPFSAMGKNWKQGDIFPWKEMNVSDKTVVILYRERYLQHNDDYEIVAAVGDGLEALDMVGLEAIVDGYNKRIKLVTPNERAYQLKRIKSSKVPERQRNLIRQWRRIYSDWLDKAEKEKQG